MTLTRRIDRFIAAFVKRVTANKRRRTSHAENVERIETLGFKVLDLRGWYEGRYQPRRYHLVDNDGRVLDNDGMGYQSTKAALKAAVLAAGGGSVHKIPVNR